MRMLVTFALDWEFKPWMRLRHFSPISGNQHLFRTKIAGCEVRALLTGIGPHASKQSIHAIMDQAPDLCISSGLTGGLKDDHRPGEVLVARSSCSEADGREVDSDEKLFGAAVECGAKAVGQFVSSGRIVRTAKQKSELHPTADAVDMETFTIMKEMRTLGVPCVTIRTVADTTKMDVPCDFERALDSSGQIRIINVLAQVARDPRQAWPLARFGARSSRAASSLARYLDRYTTFLAVNQERLESSLQQISQ